MTPATMKAIQQHAFGGPEVLRYEDAPVPELQPGEVLVRVHAVGLNPPDWYLREGYKMLPPEWQPTVAFPLILGTDISGVVEAVADDVKDFAVGDEVYSMVRFPQRPGWWQPGVCAIRQRCGKRDRAQAPAHQPRAGCCGADVLADRMAVHDRAGARYTESAPATPA